MELYFEEIPEGSRIFKGPLLLGVLTTRHNRGLTRDGAVVWEDMPREGWAVHWTSPQVSVTDLEAVVASLPPRQA